MGEAALRYVAAEPGFHCSPILYQMYVGFKTLIELLVSESNFSQFFANFGKKSFEKKLLKALEANFKNLRMKKKITSFNSQKSAKVYNFDAIFEKTFHKKFCPQITKTSSTCLKKALCRYLICPQSHTIACLESAGFLLRARHSAALGKLKNFDRNCLSSSTRSVIYNKKYERINT